MSFGIVYAINTSHEKRGKKIPLHTGTFITDFGLEGDYHAGPGHRQVSLLTKESLDAMQALGVEGLCFGHYIENICTQGIALDTLTVGTMLKCGAIKLEITQVGKECHAAQGCSVIEKVGYCVLPTQGIFARVIKPGVLYRGDTIEVKHV